MADALKSFHDKDVTEFSEASVSGFIMEFEDVFGLDDPLCMRLFSPSEEEPVSPAIEGSDLEDAEAGDFDVDDYLLSAEAQ